MKNMKSEIEQRWFYKGNYTKLYGNASLENARIVVVGEVHRNRLIGISRFLQRKYFTWEWSSSRVHVRELLASHAKRGDFLLRESYKRGKKYSVRKSHNEFSTPEGVVTIGWDNMLWNRIAWFWHRRARRAFIRGDHKKAHYFDAKVESCSPKRDESLKRTIVAAEKKLTNGRQLWVVAGEAHVLGNEALRRLLSSYSYIVVTANTRDKDYRQKSINIDHLVP